jgi:hypothetical protein
MKNLTMLFLVVVLVVVLAYAGINGLMNDHATGPLFIFLAVCTATGLSLDINRLVRERVRRNNIKKFGRD